MSDSRIPAAVLAQNVSMTYRGDVRAVRDLSLQIDQGEVIALLGPNGAGKTTLLDVILGLQHPQRGSASILGFTPPQAISRGLVGVVNQTGALPLDLKVGQMLNLFHGFYEDAAPVDEVIERTGLARLKNRKIVKLSGGEQQRVRLGLVLLPDPLVLFLDEPTAGMDPTARQEFWRVMEDSAGSGRTIVFATHYLAEAESFAARTVIMRGGQIAADAPTSALMKRGRATLTIDMDEASYEQVRSALDQNGNQSEWGEGVATVHGRDLDAAARVVLSVPGARNLRVSDASLEDIFTEIAAQQPGVGGRGNDD